ncbi:MAG: hypothetical protein KA369_02300 [Spirochaetes bacterium]|nr:hypothetical protein [Spirochaetota bacterium]
MMIRRGRKRVAFISLMMALLMQWACITSPVTLTSSSTPVHDKKINMNYGPVQGSHRVWSVFGLWMVGRPDIDLAIQDALKQKGGDALINVSCYQKTSWFFFVSMHKVVVEGEAVSFDKGAPDKDKGRQSIKAKKVNVTEEKNVDKKK